VVVERPLLGGRDAPLGNLSPIGRAGCPSGLDGRDAAAAASGTSSRIRKIFYSRRDPREGSRKSFRTSRRWMGGRSPAPRLPLVDRAGGTHFSKTSKTAPLFRIYFFNFFLKKTDCRSAHTHAARSFYFFFAGPLVV
jgi:hypothetical protein